MTRDTVTWKMPDDESSIDVQEDEIILDAAEEQRLDVLDSYRAGAFFTDADQLKLGIVNPAT